MASRAEIAAILETTSDKGVVVTETSKLDIESYIQNYSGRTRFERLYYIGSHSVILSVDALKAAVVEAKKGRDVKRYLAARDKFASVAPNEPEAKLDQQWVEITKNRNKAEGDRLEAELKQYKNNLIKESIRMGNEDCGQFYHSIGELQKAYESFSRMRPDVSTNKHVVDISRHLINVAIEQRNWLAVTGNVTKIQVMASSSTEAKNLLPFANAGAGLANMAMEKYYEAASSFLAVEPSLGLAYNHTISPNDIAIYGGLCALASMDRKQLQTKVLENSSFRTFLELEPHIRRAIQYFVNGRYASCLSIVQNYRNDFLLDINLWPHISNIYQKIKTKSIVQYFIPFSCVTIDSLVEALGLQGESIEDELLNMIKSGALEARVDTINRTLTAVSSSRRATLQRQTLESAKAYEREMRHRILRMNIINAGLEVKPLKRMSIAGLPEMDDAPSDQMPGGRPRSFAEMDKDTTNYGRAR